MSYRTCVGCIAQKHQCDARNKLRALLKGLGVTSVKWKCSQRVARINIGDLVWVDTYASQTRSDEDGDYYRDFFPGIAVRDCGSKMLVYIKPGAFGREHLAAGEEIPFEPSAHGFCKIPLSRITKREGEQETVCKGCNRPLQSVGCNCGDYQ